MNQIYIVSERVYKKAYHIDPWFEETILKVFDDYHKAVMYICDRIKMDHVVLDTSGQAIGIDLTNWRKYEPNPDKFEIGIFTKSIEYDTATYYESKCYRFRVYNVE